MGARLAHRGAFGAQWSPAPGVWFGMQSRELGTLATDGPLLLDGALDNRWQLALRRGGAAPTERARPAMRHLLLELLEAEGSACARARWPERSRSHGGAAANGSCCWPAIASATARCTSRSTAPGGSCSRASTKRCSRSTPSRHGRTATPSRCSRARSGRSPARPAWPASIPWRPARPSRSMRGALSMQRYWNIPVAVKHDDDQRHAAELRDVFLDTLQFADESLTPESASR